MTTFVVHAVAMVNGVPTDGLMCVAYAESRFNSPPQLGTPAPMDGSNPGDIGSPDGGPTPSAESSGGPGHVTIVVPDMTNYWIGCYDVTNPSLMAWEGPKMATPHTSLQGWISAGDVTAQRSASTTTVGGPGPYTLPTPTISVASTAGFHTTGWLIGQNETGSSPAFVGIQYTGLTPTTFTGCTGGDGAVLNADDFISQGYPNGTRRRIVTVSFDISLTAAGDAVQMAGFSTLNGALQFIPVPAATNFSATITVIALTLQAILLVDPLGLYGLQPQLTGAGTFSLSQWVEVDL